MTKPMIYDVYWEGPFDLDDAIATNNNYMHEGHCLYQIYGDHPCYGRDVLLYIGKTERGVTMRLNEHHNRFSSQVDNVKVFVASCGEFIGWSNWKSIEKYTLIERTVISDIEALLIYAHQPAYNSSNIKSPHLNRPNVEFRDFRVFNTGRRKSLLPEISTEFWLS